MDSNNVKTENETVVEKENPVAEKNTVVEENNTVVDEKNTVVDEKNTVVEENNTVVEEKNTNEVANIESKVIKQLEYYFSDTNLPYDKFLKNETKVDDGWVKISVLLTFKRLASITKESSTIISAVKNATDSILEVDEINEKIRRKTNKTVPVANQEFLNEMIERSIYCKGFPKTATMDELLDFAATFGDKITKVTPRKLKTKEFKGTLYLTFITKEHAEQFLKQESVKYKDVELIRMWEKDFIQEKKKEYEEKLAKKDQKMKENEKIFKNGYLIKADNLDETATVDNIKAVCSKFEWQVSFVKIDDEKKVAWIRLKPITAAKDLLEEIGDKKNDLNIDFSIPDEEAERTILNEMVKEMKNVLQKKDKLKKENKKIKGFKRYHKRKNEDGSSNNKRIKTNGN